MMDNFKDISIPATFSIKKALKQMDISAKKILVVVSDTNRLLGVLTDGDIRRWILNNGSLEETVAKIMNDHPNYIYDYEFSIEKAKELMTHKKVESIPVVNEQHQLLRMVFWYDVFEEQIPYRRNFNLPVVIMAGGQGARLYPYTKILPKPLIPIGEKPIVEIIIDRFHECGCKNFYMSVNYKANMIKAYFNDFAHDYEIDYIQEERPLGTAGSLYLIKNKIKETFFVSNCDILINADYGDIVQYHLENKNKITLVVSLKHFTIPYGVVEIGETQELKNMKEKPEYDFLVNSGMYLLEPETIDDIPDDQFFHITDLIQMYLNKGEKVGVYPVSEKSWMDMGQIEDLQNMLQAFGVK